MLCKPVKIFSRTRFSAIYFYCTRYIILVFLLKAEVRFFEYDGCPYRFEPEYTDEELFERRMQRERAEQLAREQATTARPRMGANWWCCCGHCTAMATEEECLCCSEWDLRPEKTRIDAPQNTCLTTLEDFSAMTNRAVVETFFHVPRVNWQTQPKPAGPNGQLSIE